MKLLEPHESELVGAWLTRGGKVVTDATSQRIESLVSDHLERLAASPDGWNVLFRDPTDGRLWELAFPHGDMHGGGPPTLRCVTSNEARVRFGV